MEKSKKYGYSRILLALVAALGVFILTPNLGEAVVDDADENTTADQDSTDGTDEDEFDDDDSDSDDENDDLDDDGDENDDENDDLDDGDEFEDDWNDDNWDNNNWSGTATDNDCKFDRRDARRLVRELEHMIKKDEREGNSTSEFESLLSQAKEISAALESCGGMTWEELDEYRKSITVKTASQKN